MKTTRYNGFETEEKEDSYSIYMRSFLTKDQKIKLKELGFKYNYGRSCWQTKQEDAFKKALMALIGNVD